ncbi:MAG: glycosyltransferase family 4 protein [Bacilli bacterium]
MKKKFLLISHSSGSGGAETIFLEVVKLLRTEEIIISLPKKKGFLYEKLKDEKIIILKNFTIYGNLYRMIVKFFLRDIFYINDLFKYIKLIKKNRINVIYSSSVTNIQGAILSIILKKKHIWHIHEITNSNLNWFDKKFDILYKFFFNKAELIFISKEVLESWSKRLEIDKNNLRYKVIKNPVKIKWNNEIKKKTKKTNEIKIGFLGSNDTNKNLILLINSFKKLLLINSSLKLILVGKNMKDLEKEFKDIAKVKYELFDYKEAESFYKEIDIVVVPSLNESWSLVAVEAMALNIPVILTKETTLINYLKDEENVLLINPNSENELLEKLIKLIENYEYYYKKFKKNNKLFFKNNKFNINFMKKINKIFLNK